MRSRRVRSGTVEVRYPGSRDLLPDRAKVRTGRQASRLSLGRPRVDHDQIRVAGRITRRARGQITVVLSYLDQGRPAVARRRASVRRGRFSLAARLPVAAQEAVQVSAQYRGDARRGLRGETVAHQVGAGRPLETRIVGMTPGHAPVADGKHHAALRLDGAAVALIETRDPDRPTVRLIDPASSCPGAPPGQARSGRSVAAFADPSSRIAAVGGGHLLWQCDAGGLHGVLYEIESRTVREVPGTGQLQALGDSRVYSNVGSEWMRVMTSGYHWHAHRYLNLHTGELTAPDIPADPRMVADLDLPGLSRQMCEPLRRTRAPSWNSTESAPRYGRYQQVGQWGLRERVVSWDRDDPDLSDVTELALDRCGTGKARTLVRCRPGAPCFGDRAQLTTTAAVWMDGTDVRVHLPDRARTRTIPTHHLSQAPDDGAHAVATSTHLFITVAPGSPGQGRGLYTVRLR